jgi:hypothetical protein
VCWWWGYEDRRRHARIVYVQPRNCGRVRVSVRISKERLITLRKYRKEMKEWRG